MLRGAIFDMDGTILESMGIWRNCGDRTLKSLGIDTDGELARLSQGMTIDGVAKLATENYSTGIGYDKLVELMWENIYDGYANEATLKPGVMEIFEKFDSHGIRMSLATATDRKYLTPVIERLGIAKYFCSIFTCKEVGADKYQPTIYEMALNSLGTQKSDTYIFEDALHAIVTAKNNGFYVVGVEDYYAAKDAIKIKALSDYYLPRFDQWSTVLAPILP